MPARMNVNNLPTLLTFRTELRSHLTPAEAHLWKIFRRSSFEGRKFRRQHSVGRYILDFYCPLEKLAVAVHFNNAARHQDRERRLFLEYFGVRVIRFENRLVFEKLEWVLSVVRSNFGWSREDSNPSDYCLYMAKVYNHPVCRSSIHPSFGRSGA